MDSNRFRPIASPAAEIFSLRRNGLPAPGMYFQDLHLIATGTPSSLRFSFLGNRSLPGRAFSVRPALLRSAQDARSQAGKKIKNLQPRLAATSNRAEAYNTQNVQRYE
jgi:hypothetical protein